MGPVQPPQRKGRMPQYARSQLGRLQTKFDELEQTALWFGLYHAREALSSNKSIVIPKPEDLLGLLLTAP
jgi:hypothetical protein